jgi:hypothetical protein
MVLNLLVTVKDENVNALAIGVNLIDVRNCPKRRAKLIITCLSSVHLSALPLQLGDGRKEVAFLDRVLALNGSMSIWGRMLFSPLRLATTTDRHSEC